MSTPIVVDIETVGVDPESLDSETRAYLLRSAESEETEEARAAARRRVLDCLGLWPLTGRVIAIGMLNVASERGRVYFESLAPSRVVEDGAEYVGGDEAAMLRGFWGDVRHYDRVVTFNGRCFDVPYLMLRSAVHGIRPSRNLLGSRYDRLHTDLLDQLTFFGATRKFSLDFYCRTFGIESPKAAGIDGAAIAGLYADGRLEDIARYCWRDVQATAQLYRRWRETLSFEE